MAIAIGLFVVIALVYFCCVLLALTGLQCFGAREAPRPEMDAAQSDVEFLRAVGIRPG